MDNPTTAQSPAALPVNAPLSAKDVDSTSDSDVIPAANIGILEEFQTELVAVWGRLPNKTFFFVLLAAWLMLFQFWGNSILGYIHSSSLFSWMLEAYNTPNEATD